MKFNRRKSRERKEIKITKEHLIGLIIFSIIVIILFLVVYNAQINAQDTLDDCKSLGYDGITFASQFGTKLECSNFTELEKLQRRRKE